MSRPRILAIASEIFPLVKTGGLADVAGALPPALARLGIATRTLVPGYPAVLAALADARETHRFAELFGEPARLLDGRRGELDLVVLDAPHLYARPGNPYLGPDGRDWPDNGPRFAALAFAGAELAAGRCGVDAADILHAHDWQGALAAAYVAHSAGPRPRTVTTIHNLAFQGLFPATLFPRLGLPASAFAMEGVEFRGEVGFLKAGLHYADAVTTVSPTYASEIMTPEGGMGLDGMLRARAEPPLGILNGIDTGVWNPATDAALPAPYDARSLPRRARNRDAVLGRFGLDPGEGPLFCVVSRLTAQKGIDLIIAAIPRIVAGGGRLAVLGAGEARLEGALAEAVARHPGRVGLAAGYDEALSHLLQGGADAILVPSRFEPCGLTQLYGLRYGCVPIVARVGGLADTVIDANDAGLAAGAATGFVFAPVAQPALEAAIDRAFALFARPQSWRTMQRRGMGSDLSWARRAADYAALYEGLVAGA